MSKNVAVFVDVANIFYAAKAGGVDIDYVTLLKAATAGRDFVRAYAYTGLDPENENQRQFHAFLARSGYKVVSKDIRKYGDGRIKANLDIELVVDMMRLARNLDIAVVVSGDGDFAPAIRAVQEMGVRCEVISFRGNTSADLIEVADLFTDIAQIARVDKTSGRSGRRVAAEGDLSMTAVPEKETEGAPRRRRGRAAAERGGTAAARAATAAEATERETTAVGGLPGNLIVLPGERLSRAPELDGEEAVAEMAEANGAASDVAGESAEAAEGRRRRRRGGRGRGRGRRGEGQPIEGLAPVPLAEGEEEDEFVEAQPALPRHTFGSVWDSQIGLPSAPLASGATAYTAEPADEDEDLEEPEVPEYLLAERRQRQRGGGGFAGGGRRMGGRGGRGGAYQTALDRERYGRGGSAGSAGGGFSGGSRPAERSRPGGQGGQRGRGGPRPGRPERPLTEQRPSLPFSPAPSGDPWSEVPAELEAMLRAEVARKVERREPAADGVEPMIEQPVVEAEATTAKPKPTPRTRTTKATTTAKPKRASTAKAAAAAPAGEAASDAESATTAAKPKRTTRARTTKAAAPATTDAAAGDDAPAKPARGRRKKADEAPAAEGSAEAPTR